MGVAWYVLALLVPIPYPIYGPTFRKRVRDIEFINPEVAQTVRAILQSGGF